MNTGVVNEDDVQSESRRAFDAAQLARADEIVRSAWLSLPAEHRALLEAIGASQWQILHEPLGAASDRYLRSAGQPPLEESVRRGSDLALGVWVPALRIVLIDAGHPRLDGLDRATEEMVIARVAWHEWGHALGLTRCSPEDVAAGERLLGLAPKGVAQSIRRAGYRRDEYTHELVAEIYSLLISRRRRGQTEKPTWLSQEIYNLIGRTTGWSR
ncbi:MAG: hypothetical protein ACYCUM_09605 [Solirubrobacteraceae bacterium]